MIDCTLTQAQAKPQQFIEMSTDKLEASIFDLQALALMSTTH